MLCADWRRAEAAVTQARDTAQMMADGDGDLDAVAARRISPRSSGCSATSSPHTKGRRGPLLAIQGAGPDFVRAAHRWASTPVQQGHGGLLTGPGAAATSGRASAGQANRGAAGPPGAATWPLTALLHPPTQSHLPRSQASPVPGRRTGTQRYRARLGHDHVLRGQRQPSRIRWISRVLINQGPSCLVIGVRALPVA
jgi:hypothetical protein